MAAPDGLSIGRRLLERMGWAGGGLGKHGTGREQPIIPAVRPANVGLGLDVKALVRRKRGRSAAAAPAVHKRREASPAPPEHAIKARSEARKRKRDRYKARKRGAIVPQPVVPAGAGARHSPPPALLSSRRTTFCHVCGQLVTNMAAHMERGHAALPPEVVAVRNRRQLRSKLRYEVERADGSVQWVSVDSLTPASRAIVASYEASFVVHVLDEGSDEVQERRTGAPPPVRAKRKRRAAAAPAAAVVLDLTGDVEEPAAKRPAEPPVKSPRVKRPAATIPANAIVIDLT